MDAPACPNHMIAVSTCVLSTNFKLYTSFLNCVDRPSKTRLVINNLCHAFSWILLSSLVRIWSRKKRKKMGYSQESVREQEVLESKKNMWHPLVIFMLSVLCSVVCLVWSVNVFLGGQNNEATTECGAGSVALLWAGGSWGRPKPEALPAFKFK